MSGSQGRKPTGRVNYIWVVAAMYLLYLTYQLLNGLRRGDAENPLLNIGGSVVFVVAAVLMLLREWRAYQYGKEHIDDPETWSDEPEEAEPSKPEEPAEPAGEDEEERP